ncbi:MAG: hypothetical protein ABIO31_01110 [Candidatus Nitrotoga sp.]
MLAGSLERQEGKDFALFRTARDEIFVPPAQAKAFAAGQKYDVSCLAIRRTNKQGKTGWRPVKFMAQDGAVTENGK